MRADSLVLAACCLALSVPAAAQAPAVPAAEAGAPYYFLLGRHLEDAGRIDDAVAALERAIALAPDSAEPRAELAALYLRQDKAVESIDAATAALAKDPDNREANRVLGTIYAALSDQNQPLKPGDDPKTYGPTAIAALEKARRDAGFDINLEAMLGRLYAASGDYQKALPLLRHVVDDQPGYQEGAVMLAAVQEQANQVDDAIRTLETTLAINPAFFSGQIRIAELYERTGRWGEAATAFEKAQTLNPRATSLTPRRAVALINAGDGAAARDLLEKTIAASSGAPDPSMLYLLAEAQRAAGDLPAAEATARRLLSARPDDVRGLHVLSLIQQGRGDDDEAEATLRSLLQQAPDDANALNSLGYMLAERGRKLDEAVTLVQKALTIEPGNASYLDSLGWAYFQQGRLELADKPLTDAAAQMQDSSVVQDHLGDLRFKQGRYEDAASAWQRALSGDGQSIDRAKIEEKIRDARTRLDRK